MGERLAVNGIKVDQKGNVFAAAGDGAIILNSMGKPLGRIRPGIGTANCAFGAAGYLYMTATRNLLRVQLKGSTEG